MKVLLLVCWIVGGLAGTAAVANDGEPTQASCLASVAAARELAERLPAGDASRYFADRLRRNALVCTENLIGID